MVTAENPGVRITRDGEDVTAEVADNTLMSLRERVNKETEIPRRMKIEIRKLIDRCEAAECEAAELRVDQGPYWRHLPDCSTIFEDPCHCDCGLDSLWTAGDSVYGRGEPDE